MQRRSTVTTDGTALHILDFGVDEGAYDQIVVELPLEHDGVLVVRALRDGGDQPETYSFSVRELSFDPISVMGKGETERVVGTSPTETDFDDLSPDVRRALLSIGYTAVPDGTTWLDGTE